MISCLMMVPFAIVSAVKQANFGDLETWTLSRFLSPPAIGRVYEEIEGKLR